MVLLHISVFFCKWWKIAALFSFIQKYKKLHLYAFNECWSGFLLEKRNLWLKVCFDAAGQISLSTLLIESLDIPQGYFLFKLFQKCVCVKIVVWTHTSFHYIQYTNMYLQIPCLISSKHSGKSDESSSFLSRCFINKYDNESSWASNEFKFWNQALTSS